MPLEPLERKQVVAFLDIRGRDATNVDPTTGAQIAEFICPTNGQIKNISASYGAEAGTTPQTDVSVRRGTTQLATVTVTAAQTPVESSDDLDIFVQKGETLNIFLDQTANADNDFTDVHAVVTFQVFPDRDVAN